MKRSPLFLFAGFLLFALVTVLLGLWQVGWKLSALPLWFLGIPVLAGLFVVLGGRLTAQATPERPLRERTLLLGAGWGLPTTTMIVGINFVDEPMTPALVILLISFWTVISLGYGRYMAGQQRPA